MRSSTAPACLGLLSGNPVHSQPLGGSNSSSQVGDQDSRKRIAIPLRAGVLIGGPDTVASHVRQVHLACPPPCPRQATCPTRAWPGPRMLPFGHRAGGRVIHSPSVVCTRSPNTVTR